MMAYSASTARCGIVTGTAGKSLQWLNSHEGYIHPLVRACILHLCWPMNIRFGMATGAPVGRCLLVYAEIGLRCL